MLALIRGAGDLATGIALRLWHSGISIVMTDLPHPTAIRRTVAFSEAIFTGTWQVEDATAKHAHCAPEALELLKAGQIPVLADPALTCLPALKPEVLVDAILAKKNLGTTMDMAPIVIGVGPGFTAGTDCHAVVETMRGHDLGRVILRGSAMPNTNIPGLIGGFAGERVIRAPKDGCFRPLRQIGDHVEAGETVAHVEDVPVNCTISGVLRGILPENTPVTAGMKAGDVDPRDDAAYCRTVSDKAAAVGGGVLEAILRLGTQKGLLAIQTK